MSVSEPIVDESENLAGSHSDADYVWSFLSNALPILAIVLATATLYRGRDIFLPITISLILAVIFTPITSLLEPYVGRVFSAALVVLFAISGVVAIGYFLTVELTVVADKVSGYSDNIGNKLGELEKTSPPWLQHLKFALSDIQRRVHKDTPAPIAHAVIQATPVVPTKNSIGTGNRAAARIGVELMRSSETRCDLNHKRRTP
jgi:predicted PurR-regulated permease PerM